MGRSFAGKLNHLAFKVLPKETYIKLLFKSKCGSVLDLNNPVTFREKMFWLLNYYNKNDFDLIKQCYDKYKVRQYVRDKIGDKYLVNLIFHTKNAEDIDFKKLPNRFVIKISQSCGKNLIVTDKQKINEKETIRLLSDWMQITYNKKRMAELESFHYSDDPSIVIEEYLEPSGGRSLNDYKIYCFNGKVIFTRVAINPLDDKGKRKKQFAYNTYDYDWNYIKFETSETHHSDPSINIAKPDNIEEMYWVAEKLSEDFPFARVDLYNFDGKIFFGEITWFPGSYADEMYPNEWDEILGNVLVLPK